jgi:hypothetical protein
MLHAFVRARACLCMYVHMYIYIYNTYTYTHIWTQIHTHTGIHRLHPDHIWDLANLQKKVGVIEISRDGVLEKAYFIVPEVCTCDARACLCVSFCVSL